ncbi:hypothetical protein C8Q75DRAFT_461961 [Abortiporus biennis]|nr:hypothetical protein C8Q75DRAFT_461961 [Abortiporus biennis]
MFIPIDSSNQLGHGDNAQVQQSLSHLVDETKQETSRDLNVNMEIIGRMVKEHLTVVLDRQGTPRDETGGINLDSKCLHGSTPVSSLRPCPVQGNPGLVDSPLNANLLTTDDHGNDFAMLLKQDAGVSPPSPGPFPEIVPPSGSLVSSASSTRSHTTSSSSHHPTQKLPVSSNTHPQSTSPSLSSVPKARLDEWRKESYKIRLPWDEDSDLDYDWVTKYLNKRTDETRAMEESVCILQEYEDDIRNDEETKRKKERGDEATRRQA